jgi:hypothetical protein
VYYGLMRTTVVGRQRHVPAGKQLHKVLAGELVWVQHDTVGGKYPHGVAVLGGPAAGAPESRVKLGFIQSVCSEFLARVLQLPPTAKIQCIARVDGDDINDFNFDVAIEVRTQYSAAIALRHTETSTALLYCPWPNLCTTPLQIWGHHDHKIVDEVASWVTLTPWRQRGYDSRVPSASWLGALVKSKVNP